MLGGDYSEAVKLLLRVDPPSADPSQQTKSLWFDVLTRLGEEDAAARRVGIDSWSWPCSAGRAHAAKRDRRAAADVCGLLAANDLLDLRCAHYGRAWSRRRARGRLYRAAFRDPQAFVSRLGHGDQLVFVAPTLALALRSAGAASEATTCSTLRS